MDTLLLGVLIGCVIIVCFCGVCLVMYGGGAYNEPLVHWPPRPFSTEQERKLDQDRRNQIREREWTERLREVADRW